MRLLLAAPRWPAEAEKDASAVRALAFDLADLGDQVLVLAGAGAEPHDVDRSPAVASKAMEGGSRTLADCTSSGVASRARATERRSTSTLTIERILRTDPYPDHWQKSRASAIGGLFDGLLQEARPEVVIVAGWRGLARDLVQRAARSALPAVVLLDVVGPSCLIHTRRLPVSGEACVARLAAHPCLACAQRAGPKTPWAPIEAQHIALAEQRDDAIRELVLARTIFAASAEIGARILAWIGAPASVAIEVARLEGRAVEVRAACRAAIVTGAPRMSPVRDDWYGARMRAFAEGEWDRRALTARDA